MPLTAASPELAQPMHQIHSESDAYDLAHRAKLLSETIGFSEYDCGKISSAVSEIAINALRHAGGGWGELSSTENNKGVQVHIEDAGAGIGDRKKAFEDGFSTFGSLGLGLGAATRCVDQLIINKSDRTGTSITLRHFLPVTAEDIDVAAISFSSVNEHENGDAYIINRYAGDSLFIAVLDGAGTGKKARRSATMAVALLSSAFKLPLDELLVRCHNAILNSTCERAVEMCLMRITPQLVEFVGIGNMGIASRSEPAMSFPMQNGSAGLALPKPIHITQNPRPNKFCFALHSDGVSEKNVTSFLSEENASAHRIAQLTFDSNSIANDDSTIVVVKG